MMNPGASGSTAAMAAALVANAIKACGTIVKVEPAEFMKILAFQEYLLIVTSTGGFFTKHHKYLTSYQGLAFHCKSAEPLSLPENSEFVVAKKMWVPEL